MNLITTTGSCGVVLDTEGGSNRSGGQNESYPLFSKNEGTECTAHFILRRYCVDDDGFISLTPSLPLSELRPSIDALKAELDGLLVQIEQRFPDAALKRRSVVSS